jgi:hypothetical protein
MFGERFCSGERSVLRESKIAFGRQPRLTKCSVNIFVEHERSVTSETCLARFLMVTTAVIITDVISYVGSGQWASAVG